jgi:hypothetical protein
MGSPQIVSLSGTGTTALEFEPQQVTFGPQEVGTESPLQVVGVGNAGATPVTISSVSISGDFVIAINDCLTTLATNFNCTIQVYFKPTVAGSRTGALTVIASDFAGTHVIPLSGTGANLPTAGLSPAALNFPAQVVSSTSGTQAVNVTNTGTASLQVSSVNISGPFSQTNTCGAAVAVNGTCSISVTYTPTGSGPQTGALSLTDNAADSPQSVALSGTGEDFSLAVASGSTTTSSITPGQTATYNLSVASASGLSGSVSLTCTGAPSEATCTASPSTATLNASGATPITVTVTTTAGSGVAIRPRPPATPWLAIWILALLAVVGSWVRGTRRFAWATLAIAALGLMLWAACGGGGASGPGNPGTPAGSYSLTIKATYTSGATTLQHNLNLSLTVN